MSRSELTLHEAVLLLALHDTKGTVAFGSMYSYAVAGALMAELLLRGRIAVVGEKRRARVHITNATPTGEPVLDEALARVSAEKKSAAPTKWIERFAGMKDLKDRIARRLAQRGILRADEEEVLFIFTRKTYPAVDPEPERSMIERMRRAIFMDEREIDPRTVILVSLASSAGLLDSIFDRKELKARKQRIQELTKGELTGQATAEVIAAVQTMLVVMPTITAATIAATTAAT